MPKWLKWIEKYISKTNNWFIGKYNECWVPDLEGDINFSGLLSHPIKLHDNLHYIGTLSRFRNGNQVATHSEIGTNFDLLIILSGPEPQRGIFEKIILEQTINLPYKCLIVQGKPLENSFAQTPKLILVSHLKSEHLAYMINNTPIVIARSGYSTIIDLVALNKHAILIPTPGQTEQEYLAKYTMEKKWFYTAKQEEFNLAKAIEEYKSFNFESFPVDHSSLSERLTKLI